MARRGRELCKPQKMMLFCLMRTSPAPIPPLLLRHSPLQPESGGRVCCSACPPLGALYANSHFSINLAVHFDAFDIGLAFCKAIYPEFI